MHDRALRLSMICYTGLLAAPAGTLVGQSSLGVIAASVLVGVAAGTVLVWRRDPADWLHGWRLPAFAALPGGWLLPILRSLPPSDPVPWVEFVGVAAIVPGVVAVGLVNHVRQRRRLADATTHASFTARPAPKVRRQLKLAVSVLLGTTVAFTIGISVVAGASVSMTDFLWLPALLPVWIAIFQDEDGREVAVTDQGLRVEQALHEWETFTAYERTDEALTLSRSAWYRSTLSFDRGDIDERVVEELGRYLPPA